MTVYNIECVLGMRLLLADNSVDAIVTDPPYELGFMGKSWDATGIAYSVEMWREALRVLKPGGHLLSFSGSRTYHRMACAIEDAGFEIRDQIMWVYGSGFPKSLDVSKAIDKAGGVDTKAFKADLRVAVQGSGFTRKAIDDACGFTMRFDTPYEDDPRGWGVSQPTPDKWATICSVLGVDPTRWSELIGSVWRGRAGAETSGNGSMSGANFARTDKGEPAHDAARQWDGWGTALKPAHEPICVARKPLIATVAANVLVHGTGALNIDGCRVDVLDAGYARNCSGDRGHGGTRGAGQEGATNLHTGGGSAAAGRWPANLIHDGSDEVLAAFPDAGGQQGALTGDDPSARPGAVDQNCYGLMDRRMSAVPRRESDKSAARFFYCAKASKADRDEGLDNFEAATTSDGRAVAADNAYQRGKTERKNTHPTVKPTALMRYLCRLVTPQGGLVLDPFTGSGSTGKAAKREGLQFIGFELSAEYAAIATARIEAA